MEGAKLIGPANPQEKMEVTILLRRGSKPEAYPNIAQLGSLPARERRHLSREEFAKTHAASEDDLTKVRQFAKEYGLQVKEENPARRSVVLAGTVEAFGRAFEVKLQRYEHPTKGSYRGRTGSLTIPSELQTVIEGVFGLDNRPQAKPHFRVRSKGKGHLQPHAQQASYDPTLVGQAYDFPTGVDGSGESIAILELGGGYDPEDLSAFFGNLGLPTPQVTAIGVDGGSNAPTGDPSGPDGEVELDIEVAGAVAPGAKIGVYFAPNTDQGFLDALTTAIHDTTLKPSVISISWGGPENTWTQQAMNAFDSAAQDAATMGISIFVASGDNGATDGDPNGNLTVDFPASCPHMTGCGGTKLVLSGSTIQDEEVWNELSRQEGATGGGVSQVFPLPTWQQSANVPNSPSGQPGRGVPDVAGDADPTTGYNVLVDGSATVIGGTSAVAPLWAGLTARINQSLGQPVGFLNPLVYAQGAAAAFHDISVGGNGGYNAAPGWDPCTGLGSPDGAKLLAALGGTASSQQARKGVAGQSD
jgi:kumamolisin